MAVPTLGTLSNRRAQDNRRVDFLEKNLQASPIPSNSGKGKRSITAPMSSGSGRIGRMDQVVLHTKEVSDTNQPNVNGSFGINVNSWSVDLETDQAAAMGLVIVENTDGSKICVSKVAY